MEKILTYKEEKYTTFVDDGYGYLLDAKCYITKQRLASDLTHNVVSVSKNGYFRRNSDMRFLHQIIAEIELGRSLEKLEVVHHINGNSLDNRSMNLLVLTQAVHAKLHQKMSILYALQNFQDSFASDGQLEKLLDRNMRRTLSNLRVVI
jgi:hypothetical protein